MSVQVKLKNSKDVVLLDESTFETLQKDPEVQKMNLLENLRKHSTGCAVYQKSVRLKRGEYRIETIYFHRYLCERFIEQPEPSYNLVGTKNGNKLDCRIENLEWRTRSMSSRSRKIYNKSGYLGVYKESKKYRSIIYYEGKAHHIGMFESAEDAARAYNQKATELYGEDARLNEVPD